MIHTFEVESTEGTLAVFWAVDANEYQALLNELIEASEGEE
jgi:hypothetical protein